MSGEFQRRILDLDCANDHHRLGLHEFIKQLHGRYQLEGIEMPLPTRTVYMKSGSSKKDLFSSSPSAETDTEMGHQE